MSNFVASWHLYAPHTTSATTKESVIRVLLMSTPGAIAVGLWAQNQLAGVMKFKVSFSFVPMRNALSHLTLTLIEITMSLIETLILRAADQGLLGQDAFRSRTFGCFPIDWKCWFFVTHGGFKWLEVMIFRSARTSFRTFDFPPSVHPSRNNCGFSSNWTLPYFPTVRSYVRHRRDISHFSHI